MQLTAVFSFSALNAALSNNNHALLVEACSMHVCISCHHVCVKASGSPLCSWELAIPMTVMQMLCLETLLMHLVVVRAGKLGRPCWFEIAITISPAC
jgi:hypothetical protein